MPVLIAAIATALYWQSRAAAEGTTLTEQQSRIHALEFKLAAENLDLQDRCSKQAKEVFVPWDKTGGGTFYTSHFNQDLNRCFILVENQTDGFKAGNKMLSDAFEGRLYGIYTWLPQRGKLPIEVPPVSCRVTLPSGKNVDCESSADFDILVEQT